MPIKLKENLKAAAIDIARATGNQAVNTLGGFAEALKNGVPARINPATQKEHAPAIPAALFKEAAHDLFGADGVKNILAAAALFEEATEPAAPLPARPVSGKKSKRG